jgi:chromate transporter
MSIYLQLCLEFAQIGLFAVGSGLASLPFLYALSDHRHWYTHADLANIIAVSESTPGPIGINMATYVGFTVAGILGGILATAAYVAPSLVIGTVVARFLSKFKASPYVEAVFYGLRPTVCGLIAAAGFKLASVTLIRLETFQQTGVLADLLNLPALVMFIVMTAMNFKWKWHPIVYIAIAAVIGIALKF